MRGRRGNRQEEVCVRELCEKQGKNRMWECYCQGFPGKPSSESQPVPKSLSCIPAHPGVFSVCSRQAKAVNLALTALKRSTRWWRPYNNKFRYTPGFPPECYSAVPEHSSEMKPASKANTLCCKGVSGSPAAPTALWLVSAEHSPSLSLTQRWVRGYTAAFREVTAQCADSIKAGSEHREDDWYKQGGRVGNDKTEPRKLWVYYALLLPNFICIEKAAFFPNHQHRA